MPSPSLSLASASAALASAGSPASSSRLPLLAPGAALHADARPGQCRLLGPAALAVQALMGVLVLASLVAKRQLERKRRRWRVWTWDVAKQLAGQAVVHGLNLLISDLVAHAANNNPCSLYFLNVAIDTTVGVAIFYLALRTYTLALERCGVRGLTSGMYGDPPRPSYWWRQLAPYLLSIVTMKVIVLVPLTLPRVSAFLIATTQSVLGHFAPDAQVVFVLAVFPLIMNIFQFCVIDQIVKDGHKATGGDGNDDDDDDDHDGHDDADAEGGRTARRRGSGYERVPTREADDADGAGGPHGDLRRRNSSARDLTASPRSMLASPLMAAQDALKPDYGATSPRPQSVRLRRPSRNSLRDDADAAPTPPGLGPKSASSATLAALRVEDGRAPADGARHVRSAAPSPDTVASVPASAVSAVSAASAASVASGRLDEQARDARRELSPPRARHVEGGFGMATRG